MLAVLMATLVLAAAEPSVSAAAGASAAVAPVAAAAPKAEKAKETDKVCWDERPTGSHVSKRFCATRDEREKMELDAEAAVSSRARAATPGGFGPSR